MNSREMQLWKDCPFFSHLMKISFSLGKFVNYVCESKKTMIKNTIAALQMVIYGTALLIALDIRLTLGSLVFVFTLHPAIWYKASAIY